jgi:hypothetical protein
MPANGLLTETYRGYGSQKFCCIALFGVSINIFLYCTIGSFNQDFVVLHYWEFQSTFILVCIQGEMSLCKRVHWLLLSIDRFVWIRERDEQKRICQGKMFPVVVWMGMSSLLVQDCSCH